MKNTRLIAYGSLGTFIVLSVISGLLYREQLANWHWVHDPVHAAAESIGTVTAVVIAFILLQQNKTQEDYQSEYYWAATGFAAMGLMDGLHAMVYPGVTFVFLHSVASLLGGAIFALVWLPSSLTRTLATQSRWFWGAVVFTLILGIFAMARPGSLPPMVTEGIFTPAAIGINVLAGILFLVAAPWFMRDFERTDDLTIFFFFALTVLFGLAELTFQISKLWDGSWWLWHLLRLMAYLLTMWLAIQRYSQIATETQHQRNELNTQTIQLSRAIETEQEHKQYLENTVAQYLEFVDQIAKGVLSRRLELSSTGKTADINDPLYRLGRNLNVMADSLSEIANQTQETGTRLASTAADILSATTQQLSTLAEQDAAVIQTSTTVREVQAVVSQTAERAENVVETAKQSVEISERGLQVVLDSIIGMKTIRERVEGIATNIISLADKTQQIGEIISSVNDIAEQSKMLALNASIEAARAGEKGKGFSVVAMEVRTLAEQSRQATQQVRSILSEIQQATQSAVMATEEGSKGVEAGMHQVEAAGQVIQELSAVINTSVEVANQIAASTRQQATGIIQLATAMNTIQQASAQSQSSTQETERSAQDLNAMASQMQTTTKRYTLS